MLFIVTFFLIFGWKITFLLDISALTACVLAGQYIYLHKESVKIIKSPAVISLFILAVYSTIIVFTTGFTDPQPILRAFRALIILIASFGLYNLYKQHYRKHDYKIAQHIFLCIFIHSILIISMYCCQPLRLLVYDITKASDYVNLHIPYLEGYQICGLTYGLSQTSVLQIFGVLLLPILYKESDNNSTKILLALSFPIIIISSILCGRTGIFISIFLLPLYLILKLVISKFEIKTLLRFLKTSLCFLLSFSVLFALAYFYLPQKFRSDRLVKNLEILDVFKNKSKTLKDVKNMYFLPKSINQSIFGIGNYGRTKTFYLESDAGWIKSIFAVGFIGTLLMVYPFLLGIYKSLIKLKFLKEYAISIILILLATLMLNSKELALLTRNQWSIQAIIIVILSDFNKKEIKKHVNSIPF